ncbi:nucleotidyltransferase family protein [Chloroflexi bacterium TSY]|nr:nucleotidyltransferase family protein [Chloroflexi bacterium TSY]
MMKLEDEILLLCTRQTFSEIHLKELLSYSYAEMLDWEYLFSAAQEHAVAPLVSINLERAASSGLPIPHNVHHKFKLARYRSVKLAEKRSDRFKQVVSFLQTKSIEAMPIKGAALDLLVYEQPWFTVSNDIDMVLRPTEVTLDDQDMTEIKHFFHGLNIEYEFFQHHDVVMNGVLPIDFQRIWADADHIEFRGQNMLVMSPEDMLISLCINSCRKRFFRLKALCDIAETVHKYQDMDWGGFVQKAKAYDCQHIVYTALFVTNETLKCKIPEDMLHDLQVSSGRIRLLQFLSRRMSLAAFTSLYNGQSLFGRKVDWSLALPYVTLRWYQIWRKIMFALFYTEDGMRRIRIPVHGV